MGSEVTIDYVAQTGLVLDLLVRPVDGKTRHEICEDERLPILSVFSTDHFTPAQPERPLEDLLRLLRVPIAIFLRE